MKRPFIQPVARFLAKHPKLLVAAAVIYLISPIDAAPEVLLGPLGYLDDLVVLILPYIVLEYARRIKERPDKPDSIDTTLVD